MSDHPAMNCLRDACTALSERNAGLRQWRVDLDGFVIRIELEWTNHSALLFVREPDSERSFGRTASFSFGIQMEESTELMSHELEVHLSQFIETVRKADPGSIPLPQHHPLGSQVLDRLLKNRRVMSQKAMNPRAMNPRLGSMLSPTHNRKSIIERHGFQRPPIEHIETIRPNSIGASLRTTHLKRTSISVHDTSRNHSTWAARGGVQLPRRASSGWILRHRI